MYIAGLSSSLPKRYRIACADSTGLENVEIVRPGYAIEYDVISRSIVTSLQIRDWEYFVPVRLMEHQLARSCCSRYIAG